MQRLYWKIGPSFSDIENCVLLSTFRMYFSIQVNKFLNECFAVTAFIFSVTPGAMGSIREVFAGRK